ncbi:alpha/beta-hydrolase [Auricularia subglabra TFB-10046 SS5]|uniref:Alpha/beta-hydrolase n=1 Tax=Auricularia subglabra (strain TFB-10046 / SS5) TaxID=717982 RepID=J0DC31_AURST|nr:alpha/beta-hydrolase [Auricularia subglabra TFB-10046 SS5]
MFSLALATALILFRTATAAALPGRNGFPSIPGRIPTTLGVTIPDLGSMNGTATGEPGVERFIVRYATASRWRAPVQATSLHTLTALPAVCPQAVGTSGSWEGGEDCLYMVLYVPQNPKNILTWVHGGSLLVGGANDPMIEGSKLAKATASVVAVVQYRLGVLGFLPPFTGDDTNLGIRDLVAALNFLKGIAVGLDLPAGAITVAGQSSGATAVRALLASPSASSLFSKAILHSDTADYAFYKPSTLTTFRNAFFSGSLNCSATDSACLNALPLATILSAQQDFAASCAELDGAAAGPVPFRPVLDNSLITASLTSVFPSTLKPILVTNVKDEGAPSVYASGGVPQLPGALFPLVLSSIIPDSRADAILASPYYVPDADDLRGALKDVITDLGFRCPDWTLARSWAARGGAAYTALFLLGATHPANDGIAFCAQPGNVCHQDEIPIVFGTARSPSAAQTQLIADVQARIAAFVKTGNPNGATSLAGPALQNWLRTTSASEIPVLPLGGTGPVDMGACVTSFWGSPVAPYDYQLHGL